MRNASHISMLFVKKEFHRQGIAKTLLKYMISQTNTNAITVNSSPYAVPIYHRLGFVDTDSEKTVDGIRFTPMHLEVASR